MKVELLVNLKVASGKILSRGTIFSDENGPIPEFIMKRVRRGMAKIIDQRPAPERAVIKAPVVEEPKEEAPEEVKEESSEKPAEPLEAEPEPAEPKVVRKPSKIKAKKKIR